MTFSAGRGNASFPYPRVVPNLIRWAAILTSWMLVLRTLGAAPANARTARGADESFARVSAARSFVKAPGVHEFIFEARRGPSGFDRIALHHVASADTSSEPHGSVMLYLPGTNMNGAVAPDDPHYSLPLYMAMHGVDFWALDYRTHFIPAATAQAELAELKGWTSELFESDIDTAARFICAATNRDRIFISGFSRGVDLAYLYAAMHPARVDGLILFDGAIGHGRRGSPPSGLYATDVGGKHLTWEKRSSLLKLVIENPTAPAPLPKYRNASDNLAHVVFESAAFGGKGGLANPFGGYTNVSVIARVLLQYDRYWPVIQDYENPFTRALAQTLRSSKIPVLAFSSTNIAADWPAWVTRSASATGATDVTVEKLNGWGHLDVICGTQAEQEVFAPTVAWLRRHRKQTDTADRAAERRVGRRAARMPAPIDRK